MCPVSMENFWTKRKIELHKYSCFWNGCISLKKVFTGPGSCPAPGVGQPHGRLLLHVLLLLLLLLGLSTADYLAAWGYLLRLARLWSLSWSTWPGATRSSSWGAHPCGLRCRCPPLHTLWMVSYKLLEFWTQSSLQTFCPQLFLHECFLNACRKQILLAPLLFCCWILMHVLLICSGNSSLINQNNRRKCHSNHAASLEIQPSGRAGKSLCSRQCFAYSWSCS